MSLEAPITREVIVDTDAVAAVADRLYPVEVPFAGTLAGATFIPAATLTGANTESRTFNVINKGQAGAGTTVMATLAFVSGVNAPASDEKDLTLSVVAGATSFVEGDVIVVQSLHVGATGLADPGGRFSLALAKA